MAVESITATAVLSSGMANGAVIKTGIIAAGVTVTQSQALAKDSSGNLILCDNDSATALTRVYIGRALAAGSPGQTITYVESDPNFTTGATGIIGSTIWTSSTAGGTTITAADNTTGKYITAIGIYTSTTTATIGLGFYAGAAVPA